MTLLKLYSETEQYVQLLGLTDSIGAVHDDATVTFTLIDRAFNTIPGFDNLAMTPDGADGNYTYIIPATAPLIPDQFGVQAVFRAYIFGVLKMTKYSPVQIGEGSDTCCGGGNGAGSVGGCS